MLKVFTKEKGLLMSTESSMMTGQKPPKSKPFSPGRTNTKKKIRILKKSASASEMDNSSALQIQKFRKPLDTKESRDIGI